MNTLLWIDALLHVTTLVAAIRVIWLFDSDRVKIKERIHRLEDRVLRCERFEHDEATKPVTLHIVGDDEERSA